MKRLIVTFLATLLMTLGPATSVAPGHALALGIAPGRDSQAAIMEFMPSDRCDPNTGVKDCTQTDTQMQPILAVNPAKPSNVVAVFREGRQFGSETNFPSAAAAGFAVTFDGGDTWTHGHLPFTNCCGGPASAKNVGVPWVAFGTNNVVYASATGLNIEDANAPDSCQPVQCPGGVGVVVSLDGGLTWGTRGLHEAHDPRVPNPFFEANPNHTCDSRVGFIAVDSGRGRLGRVYVACNVTQSITGTGSTTVGVTFSDDGGVTWTDNSNVVVGGVPVSASFQLSGIRVADNGDLWVSIRSFASANLRDEDPIQVVIYGGARSVPSTTSTPLRPTSNSLVALANHHLDRQVRDNDLPIMVNDPIRKLTYVCWSDGRFRHDKVEDDMNGVFGVNDIVCSTSRDGQIWSGADPVQPKLIVVNRNPATTTGDDLVNHWAPAVGFTSTGRMMVAYRQRQEANTPDDGGWLGDHRADTMLQTSDDGGTTFSAALRLNRIDGDAGYAAVSPRGECSRISCEQLAYFGEYTGLAVAGPFLYVARAEAVQVDPSESNAFPPKFHHQRIWVAVVNPTAVR